MKKGTAVTARYTRKTINNNLINFLLSKRIFFEKIAENKIFKTIDVKLEKMEGILPHIHQMMDDLPIFFPTINSLYQNIFNIFLLLLEESRKFTSNEKLIEEKLKFVHSKKVDFNDEDLAIVSVLEINNYLIDFFSKKKFSIENNKTDYIDFVLILTELNSILKSKNAVKNDIFLLVNDWFKFFKLFRTNILFNSDTLSIQILNVCVDILNFEFRTLSFLVKNNINEVNENVYYSHNYLQRFLITPETKEILDFNKNATRLVKSIIYSTIEEIQFIKSLREQKNFNNLIYNIKIKSDYDKLLQTTNLETIYKIFSENVNLLLEKNNLSSLPYLVSSTLLQIGYLIALDSIKHQEEKSSPLIVKTQLNLHIAQEIISYIINEDVLKAYAQYSKLNSELHPTCYYFVRIVFFIQEMLLAKFTLMNNSILLKEDKSKYQLVQLAIAQIQFLLKAQQKLLLFIKSTFNEQAIGFWLFFLPNSSFNYNVRKMYPLSMELPQNNIPHKLIPINEIDKLDEEIFKDLESLFENKCSDIKLVKNCFLLNSIKHTFNFFGGDFTFLTKVPEETSYVSLMDFREGIETSNQYQSILSQPVENKQAENPTHKKKKKKKKKKSDHTATVPHKPTNPRKMFFKPVPVIFIEEKDEKIQGLYNMFNTAKDINDLSTPENYRIFQNIVKRFDTILNDNPSPKIKFIAHLHLVELKLIHSSNELKLQDEVINFSERNMEHVYILYNDALKLMGDLESSAKLLPSQHYDFGKKNIEYIQYIITTHQEALTKTLDDFHKEYKSLCESRKYYQMFPSWYLDKEEPSERAKAHRKLKNWLPYFNLLNYRFNERLERLNNVGMELATFTRRTP